MLRCLGVAVLAAYALLVVLGWMRAGELTAADEYAVGSGEYYRGALFMSVLGALVLIPLGALLLALGMKRNEGKPRSPGVTALLRVFLFGVGLFWAFGVVAGTIGTVADLRLSEIVKLPVAIALMGGLAWIALKAAMLLGPRRSTRPVSPAESGPR